MGLSSKQVISGGGDLPDWPNLPPPPVKALQQPRQLHHHQQAAASTAPQKRHAESTDPAPPALRCPRCDSTNTKFCYYNNYSRSQPRYLCKACRRHWTSGGTLRNVPVGGSRKTKRPRTTTSSASFAAAATNVGRSGSGSGGAHASNNTSSSPPSSSILLPTAAQGIHGCAMDALVQAPLLRYSSLLDVPELDYLNGGGGITGPGLCGTGASLAHLLSLPPLSLPFSTAALGSFLDLASGCSGGDAPYSNIASLPPFFPFVGQSEASNTAVPVNDATSDPINNASSAWRSSSGTSQLLPISADDSSSTNVLSPPPAAEAAAGSCGGGMTAPWVDDFAGIFSTLQQPQDYHLF